MGNEIAYVQSSLAYDIHTILLEHPGLTPQADPIASNKFFKSHKCTLEREGLVLVKLYIKRDPALDKDLSRVKSQFESLHSLQNAFPNICLGKFIETPKAGFFVRQYFITSLVQKYHKHPFLTHVDRAWIAFQLLEAVKQLHERQVYHGDIKPENIMLTSWNWLLLTDISSFYKPAGILEADLTAYKFFFQSGKRENCYLAPERLCLKDPNTVELRPEMDIFAVGCVLAELFTEGNRLFNFPDLNLYRKNEFPLEKALKSLVNLPLFPLLTSMLNLNADQRPTIQECCQQWQQVVFPACFSRVVFPLLSPLVSTSVGKSDSDEIVSIVVENSQHLWKYLLRETWWINYITGEKLSSESGLDAGLSDPRSILIIIDLICSHIRFLKKPHWKSIAIDMLRSFAPYIEDEEKLHRILPYLFAIMTEKEERGAVVVKALHTAVDILKSVRKLALYEVVIFDDYIWPFLLTLRQSESLYVRYSLCKLIPEIARQGKKFLNLTLALLKNTQQTETIAYDKKVAELCTKVFGVLKEQFVHSSKDLYAVVFEGLKQAPAIAGWEFTSSFLLKMYNEYRHSPVPVDKPLSLLLAEILSSVAPAPLHQVAFAIAERGLFSNDETFMHSSLGILERASIRTDELMNLLNRSKALLIHPNAWIRSRFLGLLHASLPRLSPAENYKYLVPIVSEFSGQSGKVYQVTSQLLEEGLVNPLPRSFLTTLDEAIIGYTGDALQSFKAYISVAESYGGRYSMEPVRKPQIQDDKVTVYSLEKHPSESNLEAMSLPPQSIISRSTVSEDFLNGRLSEKVMHTRRTPSRGPLELQRTSSTPADMCPFKFSVLHVLPENSAPVNTLAFYETNPNLFLTLTSTGEAKLWNLSTILSLETAGIRSMKTLKLNCTRARTAAVFANTNNALVVVDGYKENPFDAPKNGLKLCGLVEYTIEQFYELGEEVGPALTVQALTGDQVFAYTTQSGTLAIGDLRSSSAPLVCDYGSQMGLFTTSAMGDDGQSIFLGSTSGYVLAYDLRFNAISRGFLYSKKGCVTSIAPWKAEKVTCFTQYLPLDADPYIVISCGSGDMDISILNLSTGKSACYLTANNMSPAVPYLIPDENGGAVGTGNVEESGREINEVYCRHYFTYIENYIKRSQGLAQLLSQSGLTQSIGQSAINLKRMFESRSTVSKVVVVSQGPLSAGLLTCGFDARVRLWDLHSPKNSRDSDGSVSAYYDQQVGDSHVIVEQSIGQTTASNSSTLRTSDLCESSNRHSGDILDLKLSRGDTSGYFLTAGRDGTVRVWR